MSIEFSIEQGVGIISLNRAPANAYDWETLRSLADAVRRVREDAAVGRATLFLKRHGVISRWVLFDAAVPLLPGFESPQRFVF